MSGTISVEVYKGFARTEFKVGEFDVVRPPPNLTMYEFVTWINFLAAQGLVFHSKMMDQLLFRAEVPNVKQ